jgi:hypothetical protein
MKKLLVGAAASALALALASGAHAAVFDFSLNNGLNTSGTDTYSLTVGGITVNVKAYKNIASTVNLGSQVDLTWQTGSGLGAATYGSGQLNVCDSCDDNPGEGLLLDFGQVVTLTQAQFSSWAIAIPETNQGNGDDADFASGNPLVTGAALVNITGLSVVSNVATWNTTQTGRQFFFAARQDPDDNTDSFWLKSVSTAVAGVPEPATWTMMLTGFSGLGAMLRQRRRQGAAPA